MNLFKRSLHSVTILTGVVLVLIVVVMAIVGPTLVGTQAETVVASDGRLGPSAQHLFGTDAFGRDVLARVVVASGLTLRLMIGASLLSIGVGGLVGILIWLLNARIRQAVLEVNAALVALPSIILALLVASVMGPGSLSAMVAVGVAGIPMYIRLTSTLASRVYAEDFVAVARLEGVSALRIALRHMLPNIGVPLSVSAANTTATSLIELSSLSFIGLGVQPPDYDYGKLLNDALSDMAAQPWGVIGPSIALVLLGLGIMLIGDGFAGLINPRVASKSSRKLRAGAREGMSPSAEAASRESALDDGVATVSVRNLHVQRTSEQGEVVDLVRGVSFDIRPGEILGLVGESGSGKSLTAMSVAGLVPEGLSAAADRLVACGVSTLEQPNAETLRQLAERISLIYQEPMSTFSPSLKIGSQLSDVLRLRLGWGGEKVTDELTKAFAAVSISDPRRRLNEYSYQLSGGLLQRSLIAHALVLRPSLLIADEPTTALDVTVQADVLRRIYDFRQESGASVLFISHDLSVVEAICDRVLVMYQGELVEELEPSQIRSKDVHHPYTRRLLDAALYFEEEPAK